MNLIICQNNCKHQQDGYCTLTGLSEPAGGEYTDCAYFVKAMPQKKELSPGAPEYGGERAGK